MSQRSAIKRAPEFDQGLQTIRPRSCLKATHSRSPANMQKISRICTHLSASKRKSRTGSIISPTFFLAISTPSAPKNPSLRRRELAGARLLFQKEGDVIYHAADSRHSRILPGFGLRGPLAKYGSPLSRRVFWPSPDLSPTNIPLPHVNSALPRCQEPQCYLPRRGLAAFPDSAGIRTARPPCQIRIAAIAAGLLAFPRPISDQYTTPTRELGTPPLSGAPVEFIGDRADQ